MHLESFPVIYESPYAKIIKASRIKLPPKASVVNYLSGREMREENLLEKLITDGSADSAKINTPSIENYFNNLPEKETDQLIMSITLL